MTFAWFLGAAESTLVYDPSHPWDTARRLGLHFEDVQIERLRRHGCYRADPKRSPLSCIPAYPHRRAGTWWKNTVSTILLLLVTGAVVFDPEGAGGWSPP